MKKEKVRAINRRHRKKADQFFPEALGITSYLADYDDDIIKLVIKVPHTWDVDPHATALQFGLAWRRQNHELVWAKRVAACLQYIDPKGNDLGWVFGMRWFDKNDNQPPTVEVSKRLRQETIRRFREQMN